MALNKKNAETVGSDKGGRRFSFIIGAMKSGTTSLFDILSQHPQICPSKDKEPDYFTKSRDDDAYRDYLALWDWRSDVHSVAIESSVAYAKAPYVDGVPERIYHSGISDCRFIYMLRDPIKRIESQVRHGLFAGWGRSLDNGIPEDAVSFSRYSMQLDKYLEYFPRENIMLVVLEEFKDDPHAVLSRICQFLEIETEFDFRDVEEVRNSGDFFNASKGVAKITQSGFGQYLASKVLPTKIKRLIRKAITSLNKKKGDNISGSSIGRWQLTEDEKAAVWDKLEQDIKKLKMENEIDIEKYWQIQFSRSDRT